jgi:hypothetical protein
MFFGSSHQRGVNGNPKVAPLVEQVSGRISCAGLQLDFPNPENAEVFACWVPFDEEIAVGWG